MNRRQSYSRSADSAYAKPDSSLRGCLWWILILAILALVLTRCTPAAKSWTPDSHLNLTLDKIVWGNHNRHTLWLSSPTGDTILVRRTQAYVQRPTYRIGGRYRVTWRGRDGSPCDSNNRLRFTFAPGWKQTTETLTRAR